MPSGWKQKRNTVALRAALRQSHEKIVRLRAINRERINIVADETGGAYIRFVNGKTFVPGRLILDKDDQFYLEFLDFPAGKTISRRVSFKGDEKLEQKR